MQKLQVKKLSPDARLPERNLPTDAGLDLFANESVFIPQGETRKIMTGIAVNIESGYRGQIKDRSSMAVKGLKCGAGVIDVGYNGDCSVVLHNFSHDHFNFDSVFGEYRKGYVVNKGDKIAQLVISKVETPAVEEVGQLWESERGIKGFGSSDKK
jgi:dUTP pyrophosphatase